MIVVFAPSFTKADDDAPSLSANKKLQGELVEPRGSIVGWPGFVDRYYGYMTEIPVSLKAGSKISIAGTVLGKGRKVAMALLDPSGQLIAATKRDTDVGSSRLIVDEVGATGKYKIVFISDQIGAFSLTANFPEVRDEKKLLDTIARLKKELADAEAELKEFRAKSSR